MAGVCNVFAFLFFSLQHWEGDEGGDGEAFFWLFMACFSLNFWERGFRKLWFLGGERRKGRKRGREGGRGMRGRDWIVLGGRGGQPCSETHSLEGFFPSFFSQGPCLEERRGKKKSGCESES